MKRNTILRKLSKYLSKHIFTDSKLDLNSLYFYCLDNNYVEKNLIKFFKSQIMKNDTDTDIVALCLNDIDTLIRNDEEIRKKIANVIKERLKLEYQRWRSKDE